MEFVAGCRVLVNPFHPAIDSELRQTKFVESVVPRIQVILKSTKRDPWQGTTDSGSWSHSYKYPVVVLGEDKQRAKMAEVEDGERDMRQRSKASRLGM
ncbi:hypothetical protein PIB30_027454, partial [Stylosanthes scabra]|nr:hypothetical protein [Stylosanthes scabra]